MVTEFKLPDIGEGITEGEIVKWLVKPGDTVKEDQPMVEIMTDKVTAEIPAPCGGVIQECRGKEGEVVQVGAILVVIGDSAAPTKPEPAKQVAQPVTASVSTSAAQSVPTVPSRIPASFGTNGKVLAAPATRKLAREMGLDIAAIAGTGPRGRVTPDDVRAASQGAVSPAACTAAPKAIGTSPAPKALPKPGVVFTGEKREERRPFVGMRRKIADRLSLSKQKAPHFAYVEEVDMTQVVAMRNQLKSEAEAYGTKLTFLPFIIKAVIAGLREYPILNSTLDEATNELVLKHYVNMGIATATDNGLIVPVVEHAETKSLLQLAAEIQELSERARTGRLAPTDVSGGTFTLTSIGSIGGLFGVPIINYPEVAIMGVNKIVKRPVVIEEYGEDVIDIRHIMYLSLSADHRIVDGAEAALFVKRVVEYLEKPAKLLLV